MSDNFDFSYDSLTADEQTRLAHVEQLDQLDPDVTARLARALDLSQSVRAYQPLTGHKSGVSQKLPQSVRPELSEEERVAHEEFVERELRSLLTLAGQLSSVFEAQRPKAQADRRFREQLRAQFKTK